jgi:glutamate 5-kinase
MKIVIKVGTHSILSADGIPFKPLMQELVSQIVSMQKAGHHLILVSSGAVASGRKVAQATLGQQYGKTIGEKQLLASLGQPELMRIYDDLFKTHRVLVSQILLTKQDFQTRKHYLNIARLLREIVEHKNIIPIINENDSVAIEELMFTDNDELAGLIAAQMNADKLIILSNVAGVYTDHPEAPSAELIPEIGPDMGWPKVSSIKSTHGRGGMISKLGTARKMSTLGITTHIASINEPAVITRIVQQEAVGTVVLPSKKRSNIKRWIAYNSEKKAGSIVINDPLYALLKEKQPVISLLPIGIGEYRGDFKKGDLIEILSSQGKKIGVGIARYDAAKLADYLGQKDKPAFIHYDQLHIFEEAFL